MSTTQCFDLNRVAIKRMYLESKGFLVDVFSETTTFNFTAWKCLFGCNVHFSMQLNKISSNSFIAGMLIFPFQCFIIKSIALTSQMYQCEQLHEISEIINTPNILTSPSIRLISINLGICI